MIRIALLTMPETLLAFPSIGLTEIASSLRSKYGGNLQVNIYYPCFNYVEFIGLQNYLDFQAMGLNKWFFYKAAYPEEEDYLEKLKKRMLSGNKNFNRNRVFDNFMNICDTCMEYLDQVIEKNDLLSNDIIGLSSAFSQNTASFAMAKRIKQRKPSCTVVMGGANCEFPMGKTIIDNVPDVDYVFSGIGIESWSKFISCLMQGDSENIHRINGLLTRKNKVVTDSLSENQEGVYQILPNGDLHDINEVIHLDYDSFFKDYEEFCNKTGYAHKPVLLFETSRGCWKRDRLPCTFCGLNIPNVCYESMRSEIAIKYIQDLIDRYADKCKIFDCVDNIIDRRYMKEVLPYLNVPESLTIAYEVNSALSEENMQILSDSRVKIVQPGIESLNTRELKLMQKGVTALVNIKFLKNCIEKGVYPIWNYLYCVPGNQDDANYENIADMIPRLRHLPPPTSTAPIGFHRFSPFTDNPEKYNLKLEVDPAVSDIYPYDEDTVRNISAFFIDINEDAEYKRIAQKYIENINIEIAEWIAAYRITDHIPKLCFIDDYHIMDSRFDIDDYDIWNVNENEKKILEYLEFPLTIDQLSKFVTELTYDEILDILDDLMEKQLLFVEEEKFLSLVCKSCNWTKDEFMNRSELLELTSTKILE